MKDHIQKDLQEKFVQGGFSEGVGYDEAQNPSTDAYVMPDEELESKILAALLNDNHVVGSNIDVDVNYGVVTLSGTVLNREMMNAARACVEAVAGVKKVVNNLEIKVE